MFIYLCALTSESHMQVSETARTGAAAGTHSGSARHPLFQNTYPLSQVKECIPPMRRLGWLTSARPITFISEHIPPITSDGMYTPYFRTHTPLSQVMECIPPISEHIPPITSDGIYTPYFRTHTPLSQVI